MPCNCNSSGGSAPSNDLPTILDQEILAGTCGCPQPAECCEGDCIDSEPSAGTTLGAEFTDARCAASGEGVTLLGRVARTLVRLRGNGFLQLIEGKVFVVPSLALRLQQLWHDYWRTGNSSIPVVGNPKDFHYGVVADLKGNLYGIRGFDTKKALHVWNFSTKLWETISPDQFPLEVSRRIFQADAIELVGFEAISVLGSPSDVRALKALSGAGLVYLTRTATAGDDTPSGCEPCADAGFAYIAQVLDFPTIVPGVGETSKHHLVFSSLGLYWEPIVEV